MACNKEGRCLSGSTLETPAWTRLGTSETKLAPSDVLRCPMSSVASEEELGNPQENIRKPGIRGWEVEARPLLG